MSMLKAKKYSSFAILGQIFAIIGQDKISGRLAGFDVIGFKDGNITASGTEELTYAMVDTFEEVLKLL